MQITIHVPAVPVAQPRQRHRNCGKFIQSYTPAKHPVNAYKASVGVAWLNAGGELLDGPLSISVVFVLPRPASMTRKTRPNQRAWHAKKLDLDNLLKSTMDGLTACGAWHDDGQVSQLRAEKTYASADESPHVHIEISQLTEQPHESLYGLRTGTT